MSGRRHRRAGAPGKAAWRCRRHQGGFCKSKAAARSDVPARGARRARRRGRQHEARAQPAADGLLPGSGRGPRSVPAPWPRQQVADGVPLRHVRRADGPENAWRRDRVGVGRQGHRCGQLRCRPHTQGPADHAGRSGKARCQAAGRGADARRLR